MDGDKELKDAREKLAARFGNATQIGGKGRCTPKTITNILTYIKHIFSIIFVIV